MRARPLLLLLGYACATAREPASEALAPAPLETSPASSTAPPPVSAQVASTSASTVAPDVTYLLDEATVVFEADGRTTTTWRQQIKILRQSAVEDYASLSTYWSPWFEEKPELYATVTGPSGATSVLDPTTIDDSPASDDDAVMYSDRRIARAPVPGVVVGATIDQRVVVKDRRPFFEGGGFAMFDVGRGERVERARLVVDVPVGTPLVWRSHGGTFSPVREVRGGRELHVFEGGPYLPLEPPELFTAGDHAIWPHVEVTTTKSWADIAARYSALVDQQIAAGPISTAVAELRLDRRAKVEDNLAKLLPWIRERVRYTGVELGEAAIVPRSPSETLARGFGDCKDQATVLVAALRQIGVDASVALLNAGTGEDAKADLPSMESFNHAIVHVPGSRSLYIDSTDPYAAVGVLSPSVRGRMALHARADTKALVRIPEARSLDAVYRELRVVRLSTGGPSRLVETSQGLGSYDTRLRALSRHSPEELEESLREYLDETHLADGRITAIRVIDGERVDRPTRLEIELPRASRGFTADEEALYYFQVSAMFGGVPYLLTSEPEKDAAPRRSPLRWFEPRQIEIEARVHPPRGFVARPLPPAVKEQLGPALYEESYRLEADGSVIARRRFDSGKQEYSPADVVAFRDAFLRVKPAEPRWIRFDEEGARAQAEGRLADAIAIRRRRVKEEPQFGAHHSRYARALLEAGFGEAARVEAQRATELDPTSLDAWFMLGLVLSRDLHGRDGGVPVDLDGAIVAHRRGKEIDAGATENRRNLAIALERRPDGTRWGAKARLKEALEEYEFLTRAGVEGFEINHQIALLDTGRYAELHALSRRLPQTEVRDAMLVASAGLLEGPKGFERALDGLGRDAQGRERTQWAALMNVLRTREYARASEIAATLSAGARDRLRFETTLTFMRKLRRYEDLAREAKGPLATLYRFWIAIAEGAGPEQVAELYAPSARAAAREMLADGWLGRLRWAIASPAAQSGASLETILDAAFVEAEPLVEGDSADGFRIKYKSPTDTGDRGRTTLYLASDKGSAKIVGASFDLAALGQEILGRIERGQRKSAKRWLDWIHADVSGPRRGDPLERHPIEGVWTADAPAEDPEMKLAVGVLLAFDEQTAARAIELLTPALPGSTGDKRRAVLRALFIAHMNRSEPAKAVPHGRELAESSEIGEDLLIDALSASGQAGAVKELCDRRVAQRPRDHDTLHQVAHVLADELRAYGEARSVLDRALATGDADAGTYNESAWLALFMPGNRAPAIEHALRAVELSGQVNPPFLHTLATVYLEEGRLAEATDVMSKLLGLRGHEIDVEDWYLYGRLAESYGLPEIARAAYARLEKPKRVSGLSTWLLVERRLAGLKR